MKLTLSGDNKPKVKNTPEVILGLTRDWSTVAVVCLVLVGGVWVPPERPYVRKEGLERNPAGKSEDEKEDRYFRGARGVGGRWVCGDGDERRDEEF